jgi:hypothetical protein
MGMINGAISLPGFQLVPHGLITQRPFSNPQDEQL